VIGRLIEIATDGSHLELDRGFLVVRTPGSDGGRIPIDDIAAVICSAHGLTHTSNVLVALADRGAPFVLCGAKFSPVAVLMPIEGNYELSARIEAQAGATLPLKKRIWQQIIRAKLRIQGAVLSATGASPAHLLRLAKGVRAGDVGNAEAVGARHYWTALFGPDFRRDRDAPGTNVHLNYGYAVLRSAMARAVVAVGLHPSLGVHHRNDHNAMRLIDDLIEPFRPLVDIRVHGLPGRETELTTDAKRHLARLLYADFASIAGVTPLLACMQRTALSLVNVYKGDAGILETPEIPTAEALLALSRAP